MKNPITKAILCYMLIFLTGNVVSAQKKGKLTSEEKENLKTSKVLMVRYDAPPMYVMTPKDAAGAGLISDLTKSDDADTLKRHSYNPSLRVHKNLAQFFTEEGLVSNLEVRDEAYPYSSPSELKDMSKYEGIEADYIIEAIVPLMGWKATYAPIKWKTYHLNLAVEVRIIRTSDFARIWRGNVGYGGLVDKEMRFHIDDLDANARTMISDKLDVMARESSKRAMEKYKTAKK
ncbi:MAG: hypothetical protein ACR2MM_01560 [Flavobacteriaceae bacterium]